MRNFIAQQVIFLGITSLLFNISCQNEKKESNLDSQSEWQEKSPKQKWDYTGNYQVTLPCADCKGIIVKLQLKKDGTIVQSEILDHERMNRPGQKFYKVLAESALRAVRLCQPLKVPPTGYEKWKDIQLNFNPAEMLRG